jgi:uncharacterized protein with PIN domain
MPRVSLTFLGDLEDLLQRAPSRPVVVSAPDGATVGAIIEDLGIPHTEIGSLCVNGQPRTSAWRPADGDEVTVRPVGPFADPEAAPPRFVLDVHLGRLARLLRLLGFDAAWSRDAADPDLAATAVREDRILLSRDRGLLKRRDVRKGCLVRSQDPHRQLDEVVDRCGLRGRLAPFSRCLVCNAPLGPAVDPPPGPHDGATGGCPSCGRRYWRGSHWHRLNAVVEEVRSGSARVFRVE